MSVKILQSTILPLHPRPRRESLLPRSFYMHKIKKLFVHTSGVDAGLLRGRAHYKLVLIAHMQTCDHTHFQHLSKNCDGYNHTRAENVTLTRYWWSSCHNWCGTTPGSRVLSLKCHGLGVGGMCPAFPTPGSAPVHVQRGAGHKTMKETACYCIAESFRRCKFSYFCISGQIAHRIKTFACLSFIC